MPASSLRDSLRDFSLLSLSKGFSITDFLLDFHLFTLSLLRSLPDFVATPAALSRMSLYCIPGTTGGATGVIFTPSGGGLSEAFFFFSALSALRFFSAGSPSPSSLRFFFPASLVGVSFTCELVIPGIDGGGMGVSDRGPSSSANLTLPFLGVLVGVSPASSALLFFDFLGFSSDFFASAPSDAASAGSATLRFLEGRSDASSFLSFFFRSFLGFSARASSSVGDARPTPMGRYLARRPDGCVGASLERLRLPDATCASDEMSASLRRV